MEKQIAKKLENEMDTVATRIQSRGAVKELGISYPNKERIEIFMQQGHFWGRP